MNSDVFGQAGDFITSPEISQVFGEVLVLQTKYNIMFKLAIIDTASVPPVNQFLKHISYYCTCTFNILLDILARLFA